MKLTSNGELGARIKKKKKVTWAGGSCGNENDDDGDE